MIKLLFYDRRIGRSHWLVLGPDGDKGFGGKCFPKDLNALIYLAKKKRYNPHFLKEVWRSNLRWRKNKDWEIRGETSTCSSVFTYIKDEKKKSFNFSWWRR